MGEGESGREREGESNSVILGDLRVSVVFIVSTA